MDLADKLFGTFFVSLALFISCLLLFFVGGAYYEFSGSSCRDKSKMMTIESYYSMSTGCMIKVQGQYLPWSEVIPVEGDDKIVFVPKNPYRIEVK